MAEELSIFVNAHGYVWRRFDALPFVVAGRLAALAQGLPVRPLTLDLVIAAADVEAANRAMAMMNTVRWSEHHQAFVNYDMDIGRPGPRRWRLNGGGELRIDIVPELPVALTVEVDGRSLPVIPLVSLLRADPDVAELAGRAQANQSWASRP